MASGVVEHCVTDKEKEAAESEHAARLENATECGAGVDAEFCDVVEMRDVISATVHG